LSVISFSKSLNEPQGHRGAASEVTVKSRKYTFALCALVFDSQLFISVTL